MKKKLSLKDFTPALILLLFTLVFCILCFVVDVAVIGPKDSSVGFATINGAFAKQFQFNEMLYKISDYLGCLSILGVVIFACLGIYQLIKGKGFKAVDQVIYLLGAIFLLIFLLYVGFDKLALNFRPIVMPDQIELEASFPSSHTLMACTVMGAIAIALPNFLSNPKTLKALRILCLVILAATVLCRLLCGAHWVTDILAGLLISITLLSFFKVFYIALTKGKETK